MYSINYKVYVFELQKNKMAIFDELETGGLPKIEKESFKVSQANDFFGKRWAFLQNWLG